MIGRKAKTLALLAPAVAYSAYSYTREKFRKGQMDVQRAGIAELSELKDETREYLLDYGLWQPESPRESLPGVAEALLEDRSDFFRYLGRQQELERSEELDAYTDSMEELDEELDDII